MRWSQEYQRLLDAVVRAARHQAEVMEMIPPPGTPMVAGIPQKTFEALTATQLAVKNLIAFEKGAV